MAEVLEAPAVVEQPVVETPASDPFANMRPRGEVVEAPAETPPPAAPTETPKPATPAEAPPVATPAPAPVTPAPTDYTPFLQEQFGVDTADALKAKLELVGQAETLKANQRDAHDIAIREMLTTAPEKAEAYFALQRVNADALAAGTEEQKRELLFTKYKVENPDFVGRMAEIGFGREYQAKYALKDSDDPDDAVEAEFAKLQYEADLKKAVPAIKTAQEAAKIAALPTTPANGPTPEQEEAAAAKWIQQVDDALKQPKAEQVFQQGDKQVVVAFDVKAPDFKQALDAPMEYVHAHLSKLVYPDGPAGPADIPALMQAIGRLTQPDAIVKATWTAALASQGATIPLSTLSNPAPETPQAPGSGALTAEDAFNRARPRG